MGYIAHHGNMVLQIKLLDIKIHVLSPFGDGYGPFTIQCQELFKTS